ncbi:MAG TPA: hypothetical protein PKW35_20360 [Nannocystaceae bacterium]|nr:hypothetical protein [Nannocystaceae bacterium]
MTSPIAKTLGTDDRASSSTITAPRSERATPISASPSPRVFGRRPVAIITPSTTTLCPSP